MIETPVDEPAPPLAPLDRRAADVATLTHETWDVVIVGGGIVGVGALLDAVSRGMRAALVEQDDIAAGTSSRSSRLIHGGLRYLEQFRFGLVREALAERRRLLTLAPHLVTIEPLLFPIYGIPYASKAFYDSGLTLYDILGARHDGGWHRRLSRAETLELAPTLRHDGLRGGLVYHDGIEDDARYTLAVARTAIAAGGVVVTRVRATGLRTDGSGAIAALRAEDLATGADLDIPTRAIVDATGVWAAEPDHVFKGSSLRILPSRGAHLVVPRERIPNTMGLTIRVPGKIVFLVPWPDLWLIGTTDAPFDGPAARPIGRGLGGGPAARHGQRDDGRRPDAGRRGRHVCRAPTAHRAVRRLDCQGLARASRDGRGERRRPHRRRQVHDVPGHGPRRHRHRPRTRGRAPAAQRHRRPTARRRGRHGRPGTDRRGALDHRGRSRGRTGDGGTAGRPARDGGPGRRRARRGAWPAAAARPRPVLPRGRGRLGRPPRAGPLARRRPRPPHSSRPGAARPRRSHRPARRGDRSAPTSAGARRASPSKSRTTSPARGASSRSRHLARNLPLASDPASGD